jgi:hypothetical protein
VRTPLLGALVAVALLLPGCSQGGTIGGTQEDDEGGVGIVHGVVVDESIRPMAGVNVILGSLNMTTAADGLFRFDEVEPGAYVIRASYPGYSDAVAQVSVLTGEAPEAIRLVMVYNAGLRPFYRNTVIEGFIECGTYTAPYSFAACGAGNVASLILCTNTDICLGNVTADRYIVAQWLDLTPNFLVVETVWEQNQALADRLRVLIGSATPEELRQPTSRVYNETQGVSPLYVTMTDEDLQDSGIGRDAMFLSQTFAARSGTMPCVSGSCVGIGAAAQQEFTMYLTMFYGYQPPPDWRFVGTETVPPPP